MSDKGPGGRHWFAFVTGAWKCRRRGGPRSCVKVASTEGLSESCCKAAWTDVDVERGDRAQCPQALEPLTAKHLREALRQLVEQELNGSAQDAQKADRLDRWVDEVLARMPGGCVAAAPASTPARSCSIGNLRAAAAAAEAGSAVNVSGTDTRTPNSSDRSGSSSKSSPDEDVVLPPQGRVLPPPPQPPAMPPPAMRLPLSAVTAAAHQQSESKGEEPVDVDDDDDDIERLEFGPTDRQLSLVEPPEKCLTGLDQDVALQNSFATVQKILHKRDTQTTELHRQLREARQELWIQTAEVKSAKARLHALLSDPSRAPAAQAEAIARLKSEASELSSRLADCRLESKHWQTIARRQRAYFLQSENLGKESLMALRRHPCGEVFLAPRPVASPFEEDDQEAGEATGWNVGKSHCNPYDVDSWPFEPNVLAARASREPGLQRCDEAGEPEDDDDDEEDDAFEEHFPLPDGRRTRPQQHPRSIDWSDDDDVEDEEEDEEEEDGTHDEYSPAHGSELDRAGKCTQRRDAEAL